MYIPTLASKVVGVNLIILIQVKYINKIHKYKLLLVFPILQYVLSMLNILNSFYMQFSMKITFEMRDF